MWSDTHFAVYGNYNRYPAPNNTTNPRTARQLGSLCAEALQERRYNVSMLPNNDAPYNVDWDGSNPAVELQLLAEQYGCLVTLSPDDRLVIHRDGYGRTPRPDSRQMDFTQVAELPVIPGALVFEGGRTHIQHDLKLLPVAREIETSSPFYNQYIPIEDLSYAPNPGALMGGWNYEDPARFQGVTNLLGRQEALKSVWKKYSVWGGFQLPLPPAKLANRTNGQRLSVTQQAQLRKYFYIDGGRQWRVLPFNLQQNHRSVGLGQPNKAFVLGYYWWGAASNRNTRGYTAIEQVPAVAFDYDRLIASQPLTNADWDLSLDSRGHKYDLDPERGLIEFEQQTYFYDTDAAGRVPLGCLPAPIRLRTSFPIRDPISAAFLCQQFWLAPGSPIAVNIPKIIKRSDVFLEYDSAGNSDEVIFLAQAQQYIAEQLNTYQIGRGYSAPYKGFVVDIPVDGVVRAVAWDVSEDGQGTTHIDYNMEIPESYLSLAEMRARRMATWNLLVQAEIERKRKRGLIK